MQRKKSVVLSAFRADIKSELLILQIQGEKMRPLPKWEIN